MKVLELFAGTRSIGKAFERRGHEVYSIEWDKDFDHIDWYADIMTVTAQDILERFGRPDVIWASPDCATFSIAAISHHRRKNPETGNLDPISEYAKFCDAVDQHVLRLILALSPTYWFILKFKALSELIPVNIRLRRKVAVRLIDVDDAPVRSRLFRGHAHNAVAALKCGRLPAKWFTDVHGHSSLMSPPHCSAIALAMPGLSRSTLISWRRSKEPLIAEISTILLPPPSILAHSTNFAMSRQEILPSAVSDHSRRVEFFGGGFSPISHQSGPYLRWSLK